jgi:NADPH:quinone reductase-like Zn-dependent oxidoreductase
VTVLGFEDFGPPAERIGVYEEAAPGAPGPGEALLALDHAPVHPADLLLIEGRYGTRPQLPARCGADGVARVLEVGADVTHVSPGDLVPLLMAGVPTWRSHFRVDAAALVRLPAHDPRQLALVGANLLSARIMLDESGLAAGGTLIQNAANSSVGRAVHALARSQGVRVIDVVRSEAAAVELRRDGAEALVDGPDLAARVQEMCGKALPACAFDAVGGAAAGRLAAALAKRGKLVTYGMLSGDDLSIAMHDILFRSIRAEGFWLRDWIVRNGREKALALIAALAGRMADGKLRFEIAGAYDLGDAAQALAHASRGGRAGKVLLRGPAARMQEGKETR